MSPSFYSNISFATSAPNINISRSRVDTCPPFSLLPDQSPSSSPSSSSKKHSPYGVGGKKMSSSRPGTGSTVASLMSGGNHSQTTLPSATGSTNPSSFLATLSPSPKITPFPLLPTITLPMASPVAQIQTAVPAPVSVTTKSTGRNPGTTQLLDFLCRSNLTLETGKEGVKEWVTLWTGRGVRVRDLEKSVAGLLRVELSTHPNLPLIIQVLQSPSTQLILPPNLSRTAPLLKDQAFREINKKTVIDCLIECEGVYSGTRAAPGTDRTHTEGRKGRERSHSGGEITLMKEQEEEEEPPVLAASTSSPAVGGLSRFLSRSIKPSKSSSESIRPIPVSYLSTPSCPSSQDPVPVSNSNSSSNGNQGDPWAPVEGVKERTGLVGFFRRKTKLEPSRAEETGRSREGLARIRSGPSSAPDMQGKNREKTFAGILLGSGKVRKDRERAGGVRSREEIQVRSLGDKEGRDEEWGNITVTPPAPPPPAQTARPAPQGKLREQQVQEVLLAYITKRSITWDLSKELGTSALDDPAEAGLVSRTASRVGLGRKGSIASASHDEEDGGRKMKRGMLELEAVNTKLAQIEFELILRCGKHFHPAIQSALHKVRFHMGYCSSIQLVKRLNALEREAHHFDQEGKVQHDITDLVKDKARMKIEAWIRLRWDIVDRWELVKLLNNDVLCKVPEDIQALVRTAMATVTLPATSFPPFKASPSKFKVSEMMHTRSLENRRPSLPNNLSTWGGSTPNLAIPFSSPSVSSVASMIKENQAETLLINILALPTLTNTRELVIEWIRKLRQQRLKDGTGWWLSDGKSVSGVEYMESVLESLELDCYEKKQYQLQTMFDAVRKAFLLEPSQVHDRARAGEAARRYREASEGKIFPRSTLVTKVWQENDGPPSFKVHRPNVAIGEADTAQDVLTASLSTELRRPSLVGLTAISEDKSSSSHSVEDSLITQNALGLLPADSIIAEAVEPVPPRLSVEIPRALPRHRKALSKLSEAGSEMAMEMASIFATRDSNSRASNHTMSILDHDGDIKPRPFTEDAAHPNVSTIWEVEQNSSTEPGLVPAPVEPQTDDLSPSVSRNFPLEEDENDSISPFPKPTSPPRPIPDRSTSLLNETNSRSRNLGSNIERGRQSRTSSYNSDEVSATGSRMAYLQPSTLSQVLTLFNGRGQLIPGLSPGMLEIELLKIVETERQKSLARARDWTQQDVDRVGWLIDEIRATVNLPQIDHIFARVRSSLEANCAGGDSALPINISVPNTPGGLTITTPSPHSGRVDSSAPWQRSYGEKGEVSLGQLRLVGAHSVTSLVTQSTGIERPRIASTSSFQGSSAALSQEDHIPVSSADTSATTDLRAARRVSFAGHEGIVYPGMPTSPPGSTPRPIDGLPSSILLGRLPDSPATARWSTDVPWTDQKDAPPPYHPVSKGTSSERSD